jgi:hypothetical protein
VDVSLQDGFEGGSIVSDDFLLNVENRNVLRNVDFSKSHGAEEGRLSDTVSTDETSTTTREDDGGDVSEMNTRKVVRERKKRLADHREARG